MFGPPHQSNSIVWGELNNLPNCRTHLRNEITLSEHTTGVGICNALKKFISDFNSSSTTDFYAGMLEFLMSVMMLDCVHHRCVIGIGCSSFSLTKLRTS